MGLINKPPAPEPPPMKWRGFGDIQLGTLAQDAAERDMQWQKIRESSMGDVQANPQSTRRESTSPLRQRKTWFVPHLSHTSYPQTCTWHLLLGSPLLLADFVVCRLFC